MRFIFLLFIGALSFVKSHGQVLNEVDSIQRKATILVESIDAKYQRVNAMIDKASGMPLKKLQDAQQKLVNLLEKTDKGLAEKITKQFNNSTALLKKLQESSGAVAGIPTSYFGRIDSFSTGLQFFTSLQNGVLKERLEGPLGQLNELQQKYEALFRFEDQLRKQQSMWTEKLAKWSGTKQFKKYQKQLNAVSREVKVIREELAYPDKLATRALGYLQQLPAFDAFFRKHSQYASLFNLPGGASQDNLKLDGLQTRSSVEKLLQEKNLTSGGAGSAGVQQELNNAMQQLEKLNIKGLTLHKGEISDIDAQKYQPVQGKRKTILDKLEFGFNVQTVRGRNLLPVTSDLGVSLGYKLKSWGVAGVGASYKMGWGSGFNDISITHEGLGLRSFVEVKLKGQWYAMGGFEANYLSSFDKFEQLKNYDAWQQSGLAGISKKFTGGKKLNAKLQLMWDFLSYSQIPRRQAFLFRVGYVLK